MPRKLKPCAENKMRNPPTKRCVKKEGAIGRRLQGKAKKYMDTPGLRKAVAAEKAKGKRAFTTKKAKKKTKVGFWYNVIKDGKVIGSLWYKDDNYSKTDFVGLNKVKMSGKIGSNMIWKANNSSKTINLSKVKIASRKGPGRGLVWYEKSNKPVAKKPVAKKPVKKPAKKPVAKNQDYLSSLSDAKVIDYYTRLKQIGFKM